MAGLWAAYNKVLTSHPIITKAMTSFTGFTAGDLLALAQSEVFVGTASAHYSAVACALRLVSLPLWRALSPARLRAELEGQPVSTDVQLARAGDRVYRAHPAALPDRIGG